MKYCEKCGAELFDDAVICTKCGRMLEPTRAEKSGESELLVDKRPSTLLIVFNFVFSLLAVLTLLWMLEAVFYSYVDVDVDVSISSYTNKITTYAYAYLWPESGFSVLAFISALPTFAFGIVTFVMTLVGKHRGERLLSGIFKLAVGALLLIGAITLMNA